MTSFTETIERLTATTVNHALKKNRTSFEAVEDIAYYHTREALPGCPEDLIAIHADRVLQDALAFLG